MTTLTPCVLSEIIEKVFDRLTQKYAKHNLKEFDSQDLLELHGLFGSVLERALTILDTSTIIHYKCSNHTRTLIEITNRSAKIYKLFPDINYCSCAAFKYQVLIGRLQYTCKHVLATKIGKILNKLTIKYIDEHQFNYLAEKIITQQMMT